MDILRALWCRNMRLTGGPWAGLALAALASREAESFADGENIGWGAVRLLRIGCCRVALGCSSFAGLRRFPMSGGEVAVSLGGARHIKCHLLVRINWRGFVLVEVEVVLGRPQLYF